MAKVARRSKSEGEVTRWLERYRRQRSILFGLGSIGTLLLSIPVLVVTWWAIWTAMFMATLMFARLPLQELSIAAWVGVGLLFVVHLTTIRRHFESLKFDPVGPGEVAAKFAARVAGMSTLSLFISGPNTMFSQVKVLGLILLIGPSLVGLSWRLAAAALASTRMDVAAVAAAMTELLNADQRVLVDDLAKHVGSTNPPQLLRELLLIDGVILLTSGDPSLTLTDSLRADIASALKRSDS